VREIAPLRDAMPKRLICDAFRDREVVSSKDDGLAKTSSNPGTGEGGREAYCDVLPVDICAANPLVAGRENDRVGEDLKFPPGAMWRSTGLFEVTTESGNLGFGRANEKTRRKENSHRRLEDVGVDGPPFNILPSSRRSPYPPSRFAAFRTLRRHEIVSAFAWGKRC